MAFFPHMRLTGHPRGMLGQDMESNFGGCPIKSDGGGTYICVEILDHPCSVSGMAGFGKGHLSQSSECED